MTYYAVLHVSRITYGGRLPDIRWHTDIVTYSGLSYLGTQNLESEYQNKQTNKKAAGGAKVHHLSRSGRGVVGTGGRKSHNWTQIQRCPCCCCPL